LNYDFVKHCTGKEISDWLKYFSEIVDNKTLNTKNYKRIEYSVWREIKKFSEAKEVTILGKVNFDTKKYEIYFSSFSIDKNLVLTKENDFARFLIEHGIIPEGDKTTKDTNSLDTPYSDIGQTIDEPITASIDDKSLLEELMSTYNSNDDLTWNTRYASRPITTSIYADTVTSNFDELKSKVNKLQTTVKDFEKTIKKETNNEMAATSNNVFNFDFGPLKGTNIRMSMYGFAIPNEACKYVAYDADNDRIMDVQILNFNCDGIFYKVPKALSKVHEGDVVFHNGVPMFVEEVLDESRLLVVDPKDGTEKTIMPARSPFGFDYVTTLVSLMDGFCNDVDPDEENPFGKMLPFLFMGNTNNSNDLLPLMFMANGEMDFSNPLMLLAMGGGGNFDTSNPLVLMALMKSFNK